MNSQTYSDVIWSLLGQQKTYDILGTEDTGFIGAIGEAIAWKYLWDQGIHAIGLGASRSAFTPPTPERTGSLEGHLTQEQIEYIFPPIDQELFESFKLKWGLPEDAMQRFSRAVLSATRKKGKDSRRPPRSYTLRFVMLLVTVELRDTWEAIVCDQEIQADG